ncbi:hypothetical protein ACFL96_06870 [Thermoproteota archaeon]
MVKANYIIKQAVRVFFVGIFFLFIAAALLFQSRLPHNFIKGIVERELTKSFKQTVTIESLSGNLLSSAKLKNIRFYNNPKFFKEGVVIEIGELTAYYDLIKVIRCKGDAAKAAYLLKAETVKVNILRNKDDRWNILYIIPPQELGKPTKPTTFSGIIRIQDMVITYMDEKGWASQSLDKPFEAVFHSFLGQINFEDIKDVKLNITGLDADTEAPVNFKGQLNAVNGQYDIKFTALKLDGDKWGAYVFPLEGFALATQASSIQGMIRSKNPFPSDSLPFWYDLEIGFKDGMFKLPFLPYPMEELAGKLTLINGTITSLDIKEALTTKNQNLLDEIWDQLSTQAIVNNQGFILKNLSKLEKGLRLTVPGLQNAEIREIERIIAYPPTPFFIHDFTGKINTVPIEGKGKLFLDKWGINLNIQSHEADISRLKALFPVLRRVNLTGTGIAELKISGPLDSPILEGRLFSELAMLYAFPLKNARMLYHYGNSRLDLSVTSELYNGACQAKGYLNFNSKDPYLDIDIQGTNLDIGQALPKLTEYVSGTLNMQTKVKGPFVNYGISTHFQSDTCSMYHQGFTYAGFNANVKQYEDIEINMFEIQMNQSKPRIYGDGFIEDLKEITLKVSGNSQQIYDIFPREMHLEQGSSAEKITPETSKPGLCDLIGTINAELNANFWESPLDETSIKMDMTFQDAVCYGIPIENAFLSFLFNKNDISLYDGRASYNHSAVSISGEFKHFKPSVVYIDVSNLAVNDFDILKQRVPEVVKPFDGRYSFKGKLSEICRTGAKDKGAGTEVKNLKAGLEAGLDGQLLPEWMGDYCIQGTVDAKEAVIRNQLFDSIYMGLFWDGQKLSVQDSRIKHRDSAIFCKGSIISEGALDLTFSKNSHIDFMDFQVLIAPMGTLFGSLDFSGRIYGEFTQPNFDLLIKAEKFRTTYIRLERVNGGLNYDNNVIGFKNLSVNKNGDDYFLNGYFDLSPFLNGETVNYKKLNYDLDVKFANADIDSFFDLGESFYKEIQRRSLGKNAKAHDWGSSVYAFPIIDKQTFSIADSRFKKESVVLYDYTRNETGLDMYSQIKAHYLELEKPVDPWLRQAFDGVFSGMLKAKSHYDKNPAIKANLHILNAKVPFFKAERIDFLAGTNQNQEIHWSFVFKDGTIGNKKINILETRGYLDSRSGIHVLDMDVFTDTAASKGVMKGYIPIMAFWDETQRNEVLDLSLDFKGNDIGLLTILSPYIKDIKNKGEVKFHVHGPLSDVVIDSKMMNFVDAELLLSDALPFKSPFVITTAEWGISRNALKMPLAMVRWKGADTRHINTNKEQLNTFYLSGGIFLKNLNLLNLDKLVFGLDLTMDEMSLMVNFDRIYHGGITLSGLQVKGDYLVLLSKELVEENKQTLGTESEKGPVIKGKVTFQNGEIIMTGIGERAMKPSFLMDMECRFGKDVSVRGSLLGEDIFAGMANNFYMLLDESEKPLLLSGSLNALRIQNAVHFDEGEINILGRTFELLPVEKQQVVYRDYQYKVHDNTMSFTVEHELDSEKLHLVPIFNITAHTVVEPLSRISEEEYGSLDPSDSKYKHILITLEGSIYDLNSIVFERFDSDRAGLDRSLEFHKSYYLTQRDIGVSDTSFQDTYEIFKLLVPEFLQDMGASGGVSSAELVTEYGGQRLNTLIRRRLLRPFERQIERNIGLTEFRIDYNVGGALLRSASGMLGYEHMDTEDRDIGIHMSSNLFTEQLMLRVKTDLDVSSETRQSLDPLRVSEIELTYYFLRNFSVNYSNIREEEPPYEFKPKYSIKYTTMF